MLTPDFADFSQEEYTQRLNRLRTLMAEHQMDAVLITTDSNYQYFTGHHTHRWMHKFVPLFALLPLEGDVVLIVPPSESIACTWDSWVEDIRVYPAVHEWAGVEVIVEVIKELGLERGRVGTELGGEIWMRMPAADFGKVQKDLPEVKFVDVSPLLWTLRICKSPAEAAYIRKAVDITNETYEVFFSELKPGMTERDVYSFLAAEQLMRGAEQPGSITFAPHRANDVRNCDGVLRRHTDRTLAEGDIVALDCGCVYRGYWSDYTRTFALTRASTKAHDAYRAIYESLQESLAMMKPGVPVCDLVQCVAKTLSALGYAEQADKVFRIGHATGLDIIEPPYMDLDETRPLEEGMVFTVEPSMHTDEGFFMVEEDVIVTDRGYEIFSTPASSDLPIY